jgi:arylsulfatase
MALWGEPFTQLRLVKFYNLFQDPFERADITSNTYWDWMMNHVPIMYMGMEHVSAFAESFKDFPPRAFPPSFNPANIIEAELKIIKAKGILQHNFPMLRDENKPQSPATPDPKKKK